jgi:thioredoxin 1
MQGGIMTWLQAGLPVERGAATNADSTAGLEPAALDALLAKEAKVLVDYQTPWCAPCKAMAPVVDQLTADWKGKAVVMRVDVDQSEALAAREKIQGVPVFVLYVAGKEKWRHAGEISKADLEAQLAQ